MRRHAGPSLVVALWLAGAGLHAAEGPAPAETPAPEGVKVAPYGTVYFNGFSNSSATNNADIPMWAMAGAANSSATVRSSRIGVKASGTHVGSASLSGAVEADFFGGFAAVGVGDNMGTLRVR